MINNQKSSEFRSPKQWAKENLVSGILLIYFSRSRRSRSFEQIQEFIKEKRIGLDEKKIPSSKSTLYKHLGKLARFGYIRKNNRGNYSLKYYEKVNRSHNIHHALYNYITWETVKDTPWLKRYARSIWPSQITLQEKLTWQLKQLTKILEHHYHNDENLIKRVKFDIIKQEGFLFPILTGVYAPPLTKYEQRIERKVNEENEKRFKDQEW